MGFILSPIISIAANGMALYFLTLTVKEITYTGGLEFFIVGGLIFGIINSIIKPIIKILSFPLIFLTGGLFIIIINMLVLWFFSYFLDVLAFQNISLTFPNLASYAIGAVVLGIINWSINLILK